MIELPDKKRLLIDSSPDLRTQLLNSHIDSLDAVLITHEHADHTHGVDDLRPFGFVRKSTLPVYTDPHCAQSLRGKFPYIFDRENFFKHKEILGGGIPLLDLVEIQEGPGKILDQDFEFFFLPHGHIKTTGLRHGKMAYLVDCETLPEVVLERLTVAQLDLFIIDCLRPKAHQTHLHFEKTIQYIQRIKPKTAVLTHLGHEWDYLNLMDNLKQHGVKNAFPATDGATFYYSSFYK